jgi:hypothetical protein
MTRLLRKHHMGSFLAKSCVAALDMKKPGADFRPGAFLDIIQ